MGVGRGRALGGGNLNLRRRPGNGREVGQVRRQRHNGIAAGLTELGRAHVLCVACVARRWSLVVARQARQVARHGNGQVHHQSRRGWSAVPVGNSVAAVSVTQGWHNPHRSATANHCVVPLLQPRVRSDVAAAAACGVAAWA